MESTSSRKQYKVYFRFVQFSLGLYGGKEFLSGEALVGFDWKEFYRFCKRQTLVGVVFEGIQRLSKDAAPDQNLLLTWFGQSQGIRNRNVLLDKATSYIYKKVKAEGFRCCILKGQGNALIYPNPLSRTPGDVDVWVNASRQDIRRLAHLLAKGNGTIGAESLNHIEMNVRGIAVELHSTPAIMNNPVYNHRLQKWLGRNADLQCSNIVSLPEGTGGIATPTSAFNAVYQLFHLYHHYFYEGVGLRQIVDYYFVIEKWHMNRMESSFPSTAHSQSADKARLQDELRRFGLWKFACAVMYVLYKVLGLSENKMIAPLDVKRGKMLLEDILQGGNFGQYDERYGFGHGVVGHNLQRLYRDFRIVRYYPAEALSEPMFRTWHFFWRLGNRK